MIFETWLTSDLKKPLRVAELKGNLFSDDNGGNRIGVEVLDDGEPATLSGGVVGYIIRADGATIMVNGTAENNRAYIDLPASAYIVIGQVSIAIKVGSTTVGACAGYVYPTTTDSLVDPGHVIPSIDELLEKIADCEAATKAAMKVANMTVSAVEASGVPTVTLTETGSGASAHKHLTFGLVPGVSPVVTVVPVTGGYQVTITDGSGDHPFNILHGTSTSVTVTPITGGHKVVITDYNGNHEFSVMHGTSTTVVVSAITGGHKVIITDAEGNHEFNVMDGIDGTHTWIRYSASQPTQDSDMKTTPDEWIGIYCGPSTTAPTAYTAYTWYKFKGETGQVENVYANTVPMSSTDSRKIDEVLALKRVFIGTCSSSETSTTKSVQVSNQNFYSDPEDIPDGTVLVVVFSNANTVGRPTYSSGVQLDVNNTGAVSVTGGANGPLVQEQYFWRKNERVTFVMQNQWWVMLRNGEMTGATASTAGISGLVPQPSIGDEAKFLMGDGTWKSLTADADFIALSDDVDTKANTVSLLAEDDTWAKVWEKLDAMPLQSVANFYCWASAFSILSGGARENTCYGTISRRSVSQFVLNFHIHSKDMFVATIDNADNTTSGTYVEQMFSPSIALLDTDDTWAKIWAKLDTLGVNESASFFCYYSTATIFTDGISSNTLIGTIARYGADTFMGHVRIGSSGNSVGSFYLTGASASSAGTFTMRNVMTDLNDKIDTSAIKNNHSTTDAGYVLDARQAVTLWDSIGERTVGKRQSKSITGSSSAQSIRIDLTNGGFFIILAITGLNKIWAGLVYTGSDGSTNAQQMNTSTGITVTTGSYCIYANFTHTSNSSMHMVAIPLRSNTIPTFH